MRDVILNDVSLAAVSILLYTDSRSVLYLQLTFHSHNPSMIFTKLTTRRYKCWMDGFVAYSLVSNNPTNFKETAIL